VLALFAALIGVIDVVSALTPEFSERLEAVRGQLPSGTPELAGAVAFAAGVAMLWLSGSLARRKHRAWQLAVVLVSVSAVAHLAKGLDVEEALGNVALLAALVHWRPWFDAPGDPTWRRPFIATVLLGAVAATGVVLTEGAAERGFLLLLLGDLLALIYLWLRAWREPQERDLHQLERARDLVARHGSDSLAFFSLRGDRRYHFAEGDRAFLAYRVVAGCALVSGDPIGEARAIPGLFDEFRRHAASRGWRVVMLHASRPLAELYRSRGMRAVAIGDEAVLQTSSFSLEGRQIRKVRQSVSRLRRAGYTVQVVGAREMSELRRAQVEHVSQAWLGRWCERGFSMAMDDLHAYDDSRFVLAMGPDGRVGGFLHLVPFHHGYSLSSMRRLSGTPNGLMEFLICEAAAWGREHGVEELSLNFSVFADILRAGPGSAWFLRAARWVLLRLDGLFQLERLFAFNRKFSPVWRTRYVCFERGLDVPLLSVATLKVERLLVPPRLTPAPNRRGS
jgi:lysyl-tRNA synthetase class 2